MGLVCLFLKPEHLIFQSACVLIRPGAWRRGGQGPGPGGRGSPILPCLDFRPAPPWSFPVGLYCLPFLNEVGFFHFKCLGLSFLHFDISLSFQKGAKEKLEGEESRGG